MNGITFVDKSALLVTISNRNIDCDREKVAIKDFINYHILYGKIKIIRLNQYTIYLPMMT